MTPSTRARASRRVPAAARALRRRPWLLAPLLVVALTLGVPQAYGAFSGVTAGASSFGAAATFATYPAMVRNDGAQWQHRSDDAHTAGTLSNAADSSGFNRTGRYTGATNGPSTWYKFDDGSGTTAADSSGAANAGALTNSPTWSTGHTGTGGLSFDGVDDHVVGAASAVDTSASFSVAAWVNISDRINYRTVLSVDGSNVSGFFLQYKPDYDRWVVHMRDSDSNVAPFAEVRSPSVPVNNRWTHLAAVYDDAADQLRLHVDGALVGVVAKTVDWAATGPLIVGAARFNAGSRVDHFTGQIDDVRTYRRALTATEIAQVHGSPATWWDFDAVSTTQLDASGNGNTGTTAGTVAFGAGGAILDGSASYVTGARPGMHTDRSFTVAASARPASTTGVHTVASQPGTTASAFHLTSNAGAWRFTVTGSDAAVPTSAVATATTPATAGVTAHVVGVYSDDADEVRIYVNGVLEDTAPATADWDATGLLTVGRMRSGGTYSGYLNGTVYDLTVYRHALGNDDVHDLYHAPAARYDFSENTTATAVDGSGNGNTATRPSGTTSWLPSAHRGGAMTFSSSGYLATAGPVLDTSTSYSVAAWVYLTVGSTGNRTAVSQDGNDTSAFFLQYYNAEGGANWAMQMRGTDSTAVGYTAMTPNGAVALNRWTHLVGVYDDGADTLRLYVNGALSGTSTGVTTDFNAPGPLTVGASKYGGSRGDFWAGHLDGVAAYQKVLTAADVAALHGQAPSLRWDVNENAGTNLGDRSGNNNNGTTANGTTWTTGRDGNAVAFDGVDDQVTTAAAPMRTDGSFTVSAWAYVANTGVTRMAVSQNGVNAFRYALGYGNATGRWAFSMSTSDISSPTLVTATSTTVPVINTWTHLTGVYDDEANQIQLYVDGTLEATAAMTADWNATGALVLGWARLAAAATHRWSGRVDEVYAYQRALRDTEVQALYGLYATDPAPTQVHLPTMSAGQPGALQGPQQGQQSSASMAFNGTGNAYNPILYTNPTTFSVEAWFKASGTAGGSIVTFASSGTEKTPIARDRHVYLDSGGRLTGGVFLGGTERTVRTTAAYNDGGWHHLVATLGPAGMILYVDGTRAAADATITSAENRSGYWRWGGVWLNGWPNRPASDYFIGTLDEVAVYPTQLTANQVARHYAADH